MIRRNLMAGLRNTTTTLAARAQWRPKFLHMGALAILALMAAPPGVEAQQSKKIPRLCFLTFDPGTLESRSSRFDIFFSRLRELGYVNGQTITIDYLSAEGQNGRFPELAAECVRLKADVIAVSTTPGAKAAKNATRTIPIVMLALGDPVGVGLVENFRRPEANITGMMQMTTELAPKRLELLKEAAPQISRVLVLSHLVDPIGVLQVQSLEVAAPALGTTLDVRDIRSADDLPGAFEAGAREGAQGVLIQAESIFFVNRARLGELVARYRLPAIFPYPPTQGEGLMGYYVHEPDLHWHAAGYVDRLLKGAKPSELPLQGPMHPKLVINLKAAKELGITVPDSLIGRADQLIE
jgi:putative tryptophan/tyrosine transport system substrate-binding protein